MKKILKKIVNLISTVCTMPLVILYKITRSENLFVGQAQLLSLIPGKIGTYIRVAYYSLILKKCSTNFYIGFGSYMTTAEVEIGEQVYIGAYTIIGIATIGDHATVASHVSILSGKNQHGYKEIDVPIQDQVGIYSRIFIGNNCWIGNGAIIMSNLGTQNVVSAGSVVSINTGDYEIWSGNPAVCIKKFK